MPKKARDFFHDPIHHYNCAQAILKAFQEKYNLPDKIIIDFAKYGGGRAPEGLCGALYAANYLILNIPALSQHSPKLYQTLCAAFSAKASAITCKEIRKAKQLSCEGCVDLVDAHLAAGTE